MFPSGFFELNLSHVTDTPNSLWEVQTSGKNGSKGAGRREEKVRMPDDGGCGEARWTHRR